MIAEHIGAYLQKKSRMIDKKKIKIGILSESFIEWPGGIEFLKYVILGLNRNLNYEFHLLIPDRNKIVHLLKNKAKFFLNWAFKKKFIIINYPKIEITAKALSSYLQISHYSIYKNRKQLINFLNKHCDIALPAHGTFTHQLNIATIGYAFDVQHKYFPEFFRLSDLKKRDAHFNAHAKYSKHIIVNALSVKQDLAKYYLRNNNVHVIPFTPILDVDLFVNLPAFDSIKSKYGLNEQPYFIVCNQFWKHKGHLTAIKALLILIREFNVDCNLILTGTFKPETDLHCKSILDFVISNNLSDNVRFLGFIEKSDQLSLILNSCSIVQPTQFEGGAGGFIAFEALAYHHRCILSDIEVNKELHSPFVTFFKVNDALDLADKMRAHVETKRNDVSLEALMNDFEESRVRLEQFWSQLIHNALIDNNHNII